MVKKKSARQKVRDRAGKSVKKDVWDEGDAKELPVVESFKVKRKIEKQLRFISKLQETQRTLAATKTIKKKQADSIGLKIAFLKDVAARNESPTVKS